MHSNHTLLDTTIEDYSIEDFVYSYHHSGATMPGPLEDVVLLVGGLKEQHSQGAASLNECVRQIREAWGRCLGYVFTADIQPGERQLVQQMFSDIP